MMNMKKAKRGLTARASRRHELQLSGETIRVLRSNELRHAISGCVLDTLPGTTQQTNQTQGTTANTCTKM